MGGAVRQYDLKCRFSAWLLVGDRALAFDPDSDPEQEKLVWTGQHQGENISRIPLPKSTKWTHSRRKNAQTYPSKQ